ncbi:unnamed protein product [Paramecium octaurelia]|uniref:Uncharacterized protein n=1 Tax=Paramecium octaurelia TaxID=43137 RepID=A0A8S1V7U6_PAROT|nr:unnamed protein product [Paramecium octaurelia]
MLLIIQIKLVLFRNLNIHMLQVRKKCNKITEKTSKANSKKTWTTATQAYFLSVSNPQIGKGILEVSLQTALTPQLTMQLQLLDKIPTKTGQSETLMEQIGESMDTFGQLQETLLVFSEDQTKLFGIGY